MSAADRARRRNLKVIDERPARETERARASSGAEGPSERPEGATGADKLPRRIACPFCGSGDSEPLSTFGSLLMTSQYYCRRCRTPFEWVRQEDD